MATLDRRSPAQPHPGEHKTCPHCAKMMRFDERFLLKQGMIVSDPAWVCLNRECQHIERVRLAQP